MEGQEIFNALVALVGAMGGWIMRIIWQSLGDLKEEDGKLAKRVSEIQILVAGEYSKKSDLDRSLSALFQKLDRIEDKLDKKVDK